MTQNEARLATQTRTPAVRRMRAALIAALAGAGIIAFVARLRR